MISRKIDHAEVAQCLRDIEADMLGRIPHAADFDEAIKLRRSALAISLAADVLQVIAEELRKPEALPGQ